MVGQRDDDNEGARVKAGTRGLFVRYSAMSTRIPLARILLSSPRHGSPGAALRSGPLGRALAVVAGGVILVAGLFVSAVVFSVLLVVGVAAGGWFWWKTRELRRQLRERMAQVQRMQAARAPAGPAGEPAGEVLDGDFIREAGRADR